MSPILALSLISSARCSSSLFSSLFGALYFLSDVFRLSPLSAGFMYWVGSVGFVGIITAFLVLFSSPEVNAFR